MGPMGPQGPPGGPWGPPGAPRAPPGPPWALALALGLFPSLLVSVRGTAAGSVYNSLQVGVMGGTLRLITVEDHAAMQAC